MALIKAWSILFFQMGKLKKRIHPSDITMNIGKGFPVPECPIPGEKYCVFPPMVYIEDRKTLYNDITKL